MIDNDYNLQSEILIEFKDEVQLSATDKLSFDEGDKFLHLTNVIHNSTFSQPRETYSIKMENNFVRPLSDDEPPFGILDSYWNFTLLFIKGQKQPSKIK